MALTKDYIFPIPNSHEYKGVLYNSVMPASTLAKIEKELQLCKGDIVLSTFPKAGTTWLQEVIYLLHNGGDTTEIRQRSLDERFPFLEFLVPVGIPDYDLIQSRTPPRLIKTHLYADFFERHLHPTGSSSAAEGPKFVVGLRNPKDNLVSLFHFYRMNKEIGSFPGTWDDFFEIFRHNQLIYGDMIGHALSWYKNHENPNIKFIYYEDLHRDLNKVIHDLASFLDLPLNEKILTSIIDYTNFAKMQERGQPHVRFAPIIQEDISPFLRKGQVGDWKNYFTEAQNQYLEKYMEKLNDTNLKYTFEL